jgi:erythrin-vacuolar iron transport family protein
MPREIDFAHLNLRDALDLAILIEEEAEDRYREFAEQLEEFETRETGGFFRKLAENEAKHGMELLARRKARFGNEPASIDRSMLWDVEAPAYEKARAFMSIRRALEIALEAETKAHDFFARALPYVKDGEVRGLFEELRLEEVEHQRMVRDQIDRHPPDQGPEPDTFVDEPDEM